MLTQRQLCTSRISRGILCGVFTVTLMLSAGHAVAQTTNDNEQKRPSFLLDVTKRVILDPTTYAPAIIGYDATMRDWKSSQPFFNNGYLEHNWRFTISGRADDYPVSYGVGQRRILADALSNLEMSAVNNLTDSMFEHVLGDRYPNHRKLIRALGWIEKSAFASYMSYRLSASHYRQWQQNEQMARQLGIR